MKTSMGLGLLLLEPMTSAALPRSSKFLDDAGEAWVRNRIKTKEDPGAYRGTLDWLLVVTSPNYRHRCRRFYDGDDPPLKDLVSKRTLRRLDRKVLDVLKALRGQRDD